MSGRLPVQLLSPSSFPSTGYTPLNKCYNYMTISKTNLPLSQISATTLPGLNGGPAKTGFSIGGFWLNGSDAYTTAADLQKALIGKEICASKSGKSLIVVGEFAARDTDFLATILSPRVALEMVDLNSLI